MDCWSANEPGAKFGPNRSLIWEVPGRFFVKFVQFSSFGWIFSGRCSVTIFLTDLDATVTQHDGNFLAVDGFPFFDGNVLAVDGKSNFDAIFTAVTQHDGKFLAVDVFRFLKVSFWW